MRPNTKRQSIKKTQSDSQPPGSDAFDGSLPRSFLRPVLCIVLLDGPTHGYELLESVHRYGLITVDLAGVYRTLRAMDHDRLLASSWEASEAGPPRRVYELTDVGLDCAENYLTSLATARGFLDDLLCAVEPDLRVNVR